MDPKENSLSLPFQEDPVCLRIKEKVRKSLIDLGHSPDAHIYNWNEYFLRQRESNPSAKCLLKAKRFYDGLDAFQQRVLLSECLETGRIYPFWYYGWVSEPAYRKERKAVISAFKAYWK